MNRQITPAQELEPYEGGLDDMQFLASLGIDPSDAAKTAKTMGIPLTEESKSYPEAEGLPEDDDSADRARPRRA